METMTTGLICLATSTLVLGDALSWNLGLPEIPAPVALAAIAVVGYLASRRSKSGDVSEAEQARRELKRAKAVARNLECIAESVRKNLAAHSASIAQFKQRVGSLGGDDREPSWQRLCKEAEEMLRPTLELATQIAHAYDEIRQQSSQLMTFTEIRTDPLTRVSNRRALDDTIDSMFALLQRYGQGFSIAMFDIDHFKAINDEKGHLHGDSMLQAVARAIDESVRDTDVVARFGGEEFVVVMPLTDLAGACIFAERLRQTIQSTLGVTVSGGVAMAVDSDNAASLLSRADAALYSAKAAGRNAVFQHDGNEIESIADAAGVAV